MSALAHGEPVTGPATVRYCGREFSAAELTVITELAAALPNRAQIAAAVCAELGWYGADGAAKAMSARVALNRMAADGLVVLPAPRNSNGNRTHRRHHHDPALGCPEPVAGALASLGTLALRVVTTRADSQHHNALIAAHHYLGYTPLAGAQLRYLVCSPSAGVVAALSFAASAWSCAARDTHLGWDAATRVARLHLVVGNARFLILPHVRVPHLASAILGRLTRRLPTDWRAAYGYSPVLVETFVEQDRFAGTSYRAANWTHVGATKGRGKLDRHHAHAVPVKDVYLYPLHRNYRMILTRPA